MFFFFKLGWLSTKGGASLLLLGLMVSIGFHQLRNKPCREPFSNQHSASVAAERTLSQEGRINVRPAGAPEELFQHFQAPNAAELTSLQPLNGNEWIASFHLQIPNGQTASPIERRYQGWFEKEEKDSPATLPLVKSYRALGGDIRIEDAGSGATLFTYQANAAYQPVAVVKSYELAAGTEWQVVFSQQPGMLSQNK